MPIKNPIPAIVLTNGGEGIKMSNGKVVVTGSGELGQSVGGYKQWVVMKPDVAVDSVVAAEDISGGGTITCTTARTMLDYPRNLLYTLTDAASNTLTGIFVVKGYDQFGVAVTETTGTVTQATAVAGTQIFSVITSVTCTPTNAAASDTADVGVSVAADVASFGLPDALGAVTDVKSVNWIDTGATKTQNVDATSVVVGRSAFRPEQEVAAADDYIIMYESTATS